MINDQAAIEVTCIDESTDKAEVKEESVLLGKDSEATNETSICHKIMAVLYKAATMLFFCGTFSYFMAKEPEPLSVLEALTYQVSHIFDLSSRKFKFKFSGTGPALLTFNICFDRRRNTINTR